MDFIDDITLTGIRAFGWHGVYPDERRDGQEFVIDVTMGVRTRAAAESDDVADTIHYGEVAERIVEIVGGDPVNLIETLGSRIAEELLAHDLVQYAFVTVHKPQAPIAVPFADVAVTVRRGKTQEVQA